MYLHIIFRKNCWNQDLASQLEVKNEELTIAPRSQGIQDELSQFREADMIKSQQIRFLKLELAKTIHDIEQKEEEIVLYQRVLKVRTELINSRQEIERTSDTQIPDLYSEMSKRSNHITRINNELAEKKKIELARQQQIMKQLEECNRKNYEIQKFQVSRIQQLDVELTKMKEAVQVYEKHRLEMNQSNRMDLTNQHYH